MYKGDKNTLTTNETIHPTTSVEISLRPGLGTNRAVVVRMSTFTGCPDLAQIGLHPYSGPSLEISTRGASHYGQQPYRADTKVQYFSLTE